MANIDDGVGRNNADINYGDERSNGQCQQQKRPWQWSTTTMVNAATVANVDNRNGHDNGRQ